MSTDIRVLGSIPSRRLKGLLREARRKEYAYDRVNRIGWSLGELLAEQERRDRETVMPLARLGDDTTNEGDTPCSTRP